MSETNKRTIAFQVYDPNFINQYETRVKESGKKVREYLIDLINADIQSPKQTSKNIEISAFIDDPSLMTQIQERLEQDSISLEDYLTGLVKTDIAQTEQLTETAASDNSESPIQEMETSSMPDASQTNPPSTDVTNLFVKITSEQRAELEQRKNETGENIGVFLNRLIDDFLKNVRSNSFPDGFDETYQYLNSKAELCDTTCSAKIPSEKNQELFAYLEQTGRSRNVLMSCLVHMDLNGQDMQQDLAHSQGMTMC